MNGIVWVVEVFDQDSGWWCFFDASQTRSGARGIARQARSKHHKTRIRQYAMIEP